MTTLTINTKSPKNTINRNIYGHFSEHLGRCIYGGLYLDGQLNEKAVEALRDIQVPVLRWPGGCFADEYHWKDGIGPNEQRKTIINTHWGGVTEDNSFGTHEFMELCAAIGCEPYVNGNLGSGTVQEMSEWVEYLTFEGVSPMAALREQNGRKEAWKLKYFGVGNENWGCGGNMRPEYYADEYRRYNTYVRNYGENKLYRIACGANSHDYNWTDVVMERAVQFMDAITLHYYTLPNDDWQKKGAATGFDEAAYYTTLKKALFMDELVAKHSRIMDKHDPAGRVGLIVDEWGTWYDVEPGTNPGFLYQQNTMRDALVAACTLNIFNKHSQRVVMANLAQTVNVLQAVLLTDGDQVVKTPTYHVFDLYKAHQDATLLDSFVDVPQTGLEGAEVPALHVSASQNAAGEIHITLANLSLTDNIPVTCPLTASSVTARILTGSMDAHNTFEAPEAVAIIPFTAIEKSSSGFAFTMPACSVMEIILK